MRLKIMTLTGIGILLCLSVKPGQSQWIRTTAFKDSAYSISSLASYDSTLYAGVFRGGLYQSDDEGMTWSSIGLSEVFDIHSIIVVGQNLFVGTDGHGVCHSSDNGTTWTEMNSGLNSLDISSLIVVGHTLFAGTINGGGSLGGLFFSTNNGASWIPTDLVNNNINSLAFNGKTIFVSTEPGGVYVSNDSGKTWLARPGIQHNVHSFVFKGDTVFAGSSGGIYFSFNGGANWAPANSGLTDQSVTSLLTTDGYIYASTLSGVFRSTNNGATWGSLNSGLKNLYVFSLAGNSNKIFAGTYEGIFYKTYVSSWIQINNGMSTQDIYAVNNLIAIQLSNGTSKILAKTEKGVYLSSDKGMSWQKSNTPITNPKAFVGHPSGDWYSGTNNGVFRSTNFGQSWKTLNLGLTGLVVSAISVDSSGNVFAGTSNGKIMYLSNQAWIKLADIGQLMDTSELVHPRINSIVHEGSTFIVGVEIQVDPSDCGGSAFEKKKALESSGTIFVSKDNGNTWTRAGIPGMNTSEILILKNSLYSLQTAITNPCCYCNCIYAPPTIIRSDDFGDNWFKIDTVLSETVEIGLRKSDHDIYCLTNVAIYLLADDHWKNISESLYSGITSVATDQEFIYAGTSSGVWRRPLSQVRSDSLAPTLTLAALSTPTVNAVRFGIGANETLTSAELTVNSQPVTLTKEGGLYFGTYLVNSPGQLNVHASATDLSSNISQTDRSYTVLDLNKSGSFLGFNMKSKDKGYVVLSPSELPQAPSNWEPIGSAIEVFNTNPVADITIEVLYSDFKHEDESKIGLYQYQNDNWEYIGGHGKNGKVTATIHGGKIAVFNNPDQTSVPKEFSLGQNYPNPFNPTTTLRYNVATAGKVTMKVYNILGQEVRTLVNAVREPGFYEVMWDGRSDTGNQVSSGMYFYRMEAGKFVETKKMLFVK